MSAQPLVREHPRQATVDRASALVLEGYLDRYECAALIESNNPRDWAALTRLVWYAERAREIEHAASMA